MRKLRRNFVVSNEVHVLKWMVRNVPKSLGTRHRFERLQKAAKWSQTEEQKLSRDKGQGRARGVGTGKWERSVPNRQAYGG